MRVFACNPSTWETEARGLLWVQVQPRLHSKEQARQASKSMRLGEGDSFHLLCNCKVGWSGDRWLLSYIPFISCIMWAITAVHTQCGVKTERSEFLFSLLQFFNICDFYVHKFPMLFHLWKTKLLIFTKQSALILWVAGNKRPLTVSTLG